MNKKTNEHWNHIYETTPNDSLGWYEKDSNKTFELIDKIENWNSYESDSTLTYISLPITSNIPLVDIWIDRAILHFLLYEN